MSMTPEQLQAYTWQREIDERNRPLSDEELDSLFPEGYKVLQPPAGQVAFYSKLSRCYTKIFIYVITVNQLNLTAVKISYLKNWAYLAQENLAFLKAR